MDQRTPVPGLWRFVDNDCPKELTLVVDTPDGPHARRIPPALPLPLGVEPGSAAELAIHRAAATWGLPDFVFEPAYAVMGSGRREQGDRLLLSGGYGAVLQSKRRTVPPKDDDGERSWLQKNASKALSQVKGAVRQLRMQSADMVNSRGRTLNIDGHAYERLALIVLDHESVPEGTVLELEPPAALPTIAVTRKDLDFLLHDVDRLPVATRTEWGHLLIDMLNDVPCVPEGHCKWRFRRHLAQDGTRQLIFGAATCFGRDIQAAFSAYVRLRHHEVGTRTGRAGDSTTLGVLLTPRHDGYRAWDTTMVRTHGESDLTEEELSTFGNLWNLGGSHDEE